MEQPPEPSRPLGLRGGVHPPLEEGLALGVDKDVGPPQRVLDELEPLGSICRRVAADVAEILQDLVV